MSMSPGLSLGLSMMSLNTSLSTRTSNIRGSHPPLVQS